MIWTSEDDEQVTYIWINEILNNKIILQQFIFNISDKHSNYYNIHGHMTLLFVYYLLSIILMILNFTVKISWFRISDPK